MSKDCVMNVFIWGDADLDGAGSILALKWLYDQNGCLVDHGTVSNGEDLQFKFSEWLSNNYNKYDRIFICDLSLEGDAIPVVDKKKVVVIDHHKSHELAKHQYKNAKAIIYEATSTVSIIRDKFKLDKILEEPQKKLLTCIDDYDCYNLKFPESIKLNILLKKKRSDKFIEEFEDGLRPFTPYETNQIKLFFTELRDQLDGTEYFEGKIKDYKVIACYVERYSSETAHIALKRYDADICFAVNLKYGSVSFRKKRGCPVKLNVLAEKFCNGGGHEFSAAGKLTDRFAQLIKDFKKVQTK